MSNVIFWRSFLLIVALSCSGVLQAASCQYNVLNEWNSGFTISIIITNDSTETINDWSVSWGYSDGSTAIRKIRGLVQQSIQTQTISIERVGGELTGKLPEFLFNIVGHTHIKNALHQRFDGEQVSIDIL